VLHGPPAAMSCAACYAIASCPLSKVSCHCVAEIATCELQDLCVLLWHVQAIDEFNAEMAAYWDKVMDSISLHT
jgi:hypothetical protein